MRIRGGGNECSGGVRGAIPHRQANCALVDVTSVSVDRPIVTGTPMIAARKRRTASDLFADFFPAVSSVHFAVQLLKVPFLSRFCRCRRLNDVFAREKISLIIPRFLFACIKQAMMVFIFLPILHKKKKFNNF